MHGPNSSTAASLSRDEMPTKELSRRSRVIITCINVSRWYFEVRMNSRSGRPRGFVCSSRWAMRQLVRGNLPVGSSTTGG